MGKEKVTIGENGIYDAKQLGTSKMIILGLQHMFAMFGATVLVPALTGLSVSTTLLFAGLGTLLFHLFTKGKVPAFLALLLHILQVTGQSHQIRNRDFFHMPASVLHVPAFCI